MRCLLATTAVILLCITTYVSSSPLNVLSCDGNCDASYNFSLPCQCNDQCKQYDNCCEDFVSVCASLDMRRPHWKKPERMREISQTEPPGNTVMFKCLADGADPITVKWYRERKSTEYDGARRKPPEELSKHNRVGRFKFQHRRQRMMMEAVVPSDSAFYTCVVSNKYGSINHTYELDVAERSAAPPKLQDIMNQTVVVGLDVTFKCVVYSDAHPHVQWLRIYPKHDDSSGALDYKILKTSGSKTTDADLRTLKLRSVSYEDAGEYTCLAGNSIYYSYKSAWLTVIPKSSHSN